MATRQLVFEKLHSISGSFDLLVALIGTKRAVKLKNAQI